MNIEEMNKLLKERTLTEICEDQGVSRTTVSRNFKKIGYKYNGSSKQFERVDNEVIQIDRKDIKVKPRGQEEVKNHVENQVSEHIRSEVKKKIVIPDKVKKKVKTKSFTITLNETLVKDLDAMYKRKYYSNRNELIAMILEVVVDVDK